LKITIHNLYPDLELTSLVYFSNGKTCCVPPNQQIDTGYKYFKGALLYKLRRKHIIKAENHLDSSIASIKDTATNVHLLVLWNVRGYDHIFCVWLIECVNDFTWDEDKLWTLDHQYGDKLRVDYEGNITRWSMNGDIRVKMKYDITYGSDYKLNIVISEGIRKYKMWKPIKIDPKRLVTQYFQC
jgi:hypothetical protein